MSSSSSAHEPASNNPTTSSAPRSTRSQQNSAWKGRPSSSGRGLTPISTNASSQQRSPSAAGARSTFSPTTATFNAGALSANRQVTSRQSSTSSTNSLASPPGSSHATGPLGSGSRSRAVTSTGSPRLTSSLASLSQVSQTGASGSAGASTSSRFVRHSPSVSLTGITSPISTTAGSGQLTSLLVTQLNILLSTLKESNYRTQVEKIKSIVDDNGMEVFATFFRRLLQSNASTIFPSTARPLASTDNAGQYKLLAEEMAKIARDPQQAEKIALSLDTNESDLFRDFDLSTFSDHFRLNAIAKVALMLPIRLSSKADLRSKGELRRTQCSESCLTDMFHRSRCHPYEQLPILPSCTFITFTADSRPRRHLTISPCCAHRATHTGAT